VLTEDQLVSIATDLINHGQAALEISGCRRFPVVVDGDTIRMCREGFTYKYVQVIDDKIVSGFKDDEMIFLVYRPLVSLNGYGFPATNVSIDDMCNWVMSELSLERGFFFEKTLKIECSV